GNSMVYFRSREEAEIVYNYLRKVDGLRPRLLYKSYFKTGSERKKFIEKFGDKKGGILLGFGRMDQGIDLPGDKLTMVVMYSMPFSKRTFQMQKDYDYFIKYNDSMLAYKMVDLDVAARRICQLIGRLIRSEEDFGVGVIIDGRFFRFYKWMRTSDMFTEDMVFEFLPSNTAYPLLEKFWRDTKGVAYNEYIESRIEEDLTLEDFL
ncbi:MAG: helicase C-terminal domain-containing protein, partial [Promethearchaeota archaeon]